MRYRGFRQALLRSLRQFMAEDFSGLYAEVGRIGKPTVPLTDAIENTPEFAARFAEAEPRVKGPLKLRRFKTCNHPVPMQQ